MPSRSTSEVILSPRQRALLERLSRARTAPAALVERCRLVLLASEGRSIISVADEVGVDRQRVRRWWGRWAEEIHAHLLEVEAVSDDPGVLEAALVESLSDRPRSGAPPKYTEEQAERVRAMACRSPSEFGLPHSQWTLPLLARTAEKEGIVDSVSQSAVWRWLKKGPFNPTESDLG
ncbi:MAG: helix-turn-helix domain-containing protein [Alphaproteobacteria bacterium]|nr:helix-turn-helix domain-containing protein [Alphaproteobacteria bacterium]